MTRVARAAPHDPFRYAKPERERRFLVPPDALPTLSADFVHIEDRYLAGTRVRLRAMTQHPANRLLYKLTQKLEDGDPRLRWITTFYLSEAEHRGFAALPGSGLTKRRHRATSAGLEWGVDVFEGALAGLVLAEREFDSNAELRAAAPPAFGACEVTDAPAFSGGALATCDPAALLEDARERIARARRG